MLKKNVKIEIVNTKNIQLKNKFDVLQRIALGIVADSPQRSEDYERKAWRLRNAQIENKKNPNLRLGFSL